jgi:hypothetical protein
VLFAVNDATRSLAANEVSVLSTFEHWSKLAPSSLAAAQNSVQRTTHPLVWSLGVRKILQVPAWGLFGFVGLILAYAGRRRRRVNIYAN